MKQSVILSLLSIFSMLLILGCDNDEESPMAPIQGSRSTNNIEHTAVYLNLETGDTVSVWDVAFVQGVIGQYPKFLLNGGYSGSKGWWSAQVTTTFDQSNSVPDTSLWKQDVNDTVLAIGGRGTWARYDFTTHNFIGRDTVTFILRCDAYRWVKFQPTIAYSLDSAVVFRYAFSDSINWNTRTIYWGSTFVDSIRHAVPNVPYGYRFGVGQVSNNMWHFAMTTVWFPTPALHGAVKYPYGRLNKKEGIYCAWINQNFDQVEIVPSNVNWITDSDTLATGWLFYYDTGPTSNHRLTPWNKTLLIKRQSDGAVWKLSFDDYYDNRNVWGYVTYRYRRL